MYILLKLTFKLLALICLLGAYFNGKAQINESKQTSILIPIFVSTMVLEKIDLMGSP
jgi:hypothetical protein